MRAARSLFAVLAFAVGLPCLAACSLALKQDKNQCSTDADCTSVGAGLVCVAGVCDASATPKPTTSATDSTPVPPASSSAPCATPAATCPGNVCFPFDNCARLGLCDGAALPALVAPTAP